MIKRQKLLGILASVALAGVGTALLVTYVRGAEHRALKGDQPVDVLVVTDTIPKGTRAEDVTAKVRQEQVPAKVAAKASVGDVAGLAGQVAVVDLLPGEQLLRTRFAAPASADLGVAPGMLQVSVSLDAVRTIGGQVREGDSVGVLASFDDPETTHLIAHKVRVTSVRAENGTAVKARPGEPAGTEKYLVTLALDGPAVERVVFAAEHGRLWLSWEPKEASEAGTRIQNKAAVNL
jgi:pilus assembly protein CpaB